MGTMSVTQAQRLPGEIILLIGEQLSLHHSHRSLVHLMLTSQAQYELLSPVLYRELNVTQYNIGLIFAELISHSSVESDREDDGDGMEEGEEGECLDVASSIRSQVRRQWSLWPDVAVPKRHIKPNSSSTSKPEIPRSVILDGSAPGMQERKRKLFSSTERMILHSLPSLNTCTALLELFPANPEDSTSDIETSVLLPRLDSLELSPTFTFELADWLNKNCITPRTDLTKVPGHPFVNFLLLAFSPSCKDLTITYPEYTCELVDAFYASRYGDQTTLSRCGVTPEQRRRKMDSEWGIFVDEGATLALMSLVFNFRGLERVVVRGVRRSSIVPLRCKIMRVEFGMCRCMAEGEARSRDHAESQSRSGPQAETLNQGLQQVEEQNAAFVQGEEEHNDIDSPSAVSDAIIRGADEPIHTPASHEDYLNVEDDPTGTDERSPCVDHVDIERRVEQILELLTPSYAITSEPEQAQGLIRSQQYEFVDAGLGVHADTDAVERHVREMIRLENDEKLVTLSERGGIAFVSSR
ncbi:hypothetical protein IAU59_005983 [Kwoniella sp. CBS 9459]